MKRIKKVLAVFLVVVMCLTAVPLEGLTNIEFSIFNVTAKAYAMSGNLSSTIQWFLDTNTGHLSITGYGAMPYIANYASIPWYPPDVKTISIEDGITKIGRLSFGKCKNIVSITIPQSVTVIDDEAFMNCSSLESIVIPNGVTKIGSYAFYNCQSLKSIHIPECVKTIKGMGTTNTASASVFYGCTALETITVDENNLYFSSDQHGVLYNKDKTVLIQYPLGNARKVYKIPNHVTTIGACAFQCAINLTTVFYGNGVVSTDWCVFEKCTNLTTVYLGKNVKKSNPLHLTIVQNLKHFLFMIH